MAAVVVLLIGCRPKKSAEETEHEAFLAANCPGMTDYEWCKVSLKSKAWEAKRQGQASAASPAVDTATPKQRLAPEPLTNAERARILTGVAELRTLVQKRVASRFPADTEDGCDLFQKRTYAALQSAEEKIGEKRAMQKTRYASRAPDLGQSIDSAIRSCVTGCLLYEDSDPGFKNAREMLTRDCRQAAVVLDDLEQQVKSLPSK